MISHIAVSTNRCLDITNFEANIQNVSLNFTMGAKWSFLFGWLERFSLGFIWWVRSVNSKCHRFRRRKMRYHMRCCISCRWTIEKILFMGGKGSKIIIWSWVVLKELLSLIRNWITQSFWYGPRRIANLLQVQSVNGSYKRSSLHRVLSLPNYIETKLLSWVKPVNAFLSWKIRWPFDWVNCSWSFFQTWAASSTKAILDLREGVMELCNKETTRSLQRSHESKRGLEVEFDLEKVSLIKPSLFLARRALHMALDQVM